MGMKFCEKLKWCKSNGLLPILLFFTFCFCATCIDTIVLHPHIKNFCDVRVPRYLVRCVIYALFLSAPTVALGHVCRWFVLPFLCYRYVLCIITMGVFLKFNMKLDGDWFLIVGTSSWDEAVDFLRPIASFGGIAILALIVAAGIWVGRYFWKAQFPRLSGKTRSLSLVFVVPFLLCACHSGLWMEETIRAVAGMIAWDTRTKIQSYQKLVQACTDPELPVCIETLVPSNDLPLVVVVIGESATRNHWHLYGYPLRTTDRLDALKDELVVFKDVETAAPHTVAALRLLFTCANVEHPDDFRFTAASAAKRAGFRSAYYTMCSRWGQGFGALSVLFKDCEEIVHLDENHANKNEYDECLLPCLRDGLSRFNLMFLHTEGSHYPYGCHVPPGWAPQLFSGHDSVSLYDRSVAYTDWFLGEVIGELKRQDKPSMMLYISDHGETPEAGSWRDVGDKSCWQVPMILWFSDQYRSRFPDLVSQAAVASQKSLRSDELLHGLLRLCSIRLWVDGGDFLSDEFVSKRKVSQGLER